MFDTVVLDGNAQVNINQNVDVQVVTADASGAVTITTDGDGSIILDADAELELDVRLDGESGIITEVIPSGYYDTSDADFTSSNLLKRKKAYGPDGLVEGSMTDYHTVISLIGTKDAVFTLTEGHVDSVSVSLKPSDIANIIPRNIRAGVSILGEYGSLHVPTVTQDATTKIVSIF